MIVIGPSMSLKLITSAAGSVDYTVHGDITAGAIPYDFVSDGGNISTATTTTIFDHATQLSGKAGYRGLLRYLSAYNAGAANNTISVVFNDGTGDRVVYKATVAPGATLEYED